MGVTNLWSLLEPCGRRIDVQALRGKRVAVDASGWIFRFIKAMRDEQGELIPNAHLIGFFRRICKLLYYNIRPVFIFDGSTPALKRQTVAERRRRREQQEARVKKTAEKLLLNRLKQHVLAQAAQQAAGAALQVPAATDGAGPSGSRAQPQPPQPQQDEGAGPSTSAPGPSSAAQVDADADLALALALDAGGDGGGDGELSESDSEPFDFMPELPEGGSVDPTVLATLPPSVQLDVMLRLRDRQQAANRGGFERRTGKPESFSEFQIEQYLKSSTLRRTLDTLRGTGGGAAAGAPRPVAAEEAVEYVLEKTDEPGEGSGTQQREEEKRSAEAAAAAPVAAAAAPVAPGPGEGALHLSFEIGKEEIMSDDDVEWEDVDDDAAAAGGGGDGGAAAGPEGEHWRERAARRQKYWSLSHGFQMGRKLAQWGENEEGGATGGPDRAAAKLPGAARGSPLRGGEIIDEDEDAQLQEAIRLSLAAGPGAAAVAVGAAAAVGAAGGEEDDDVMWEDIPEDEEIPVAPVPSTVGLEAVSKAPEAGEMQEAAAAVAGAAVPTEAGAPVSMIEKEPSAIETLEKMPLEASKAQLPKPVAAPALPAAAVATEAVSEPEAPPPRPVSSASEAAAPKSAAQEPPAPSVVEALAPTAAPAAPSPAAPSKAAAAVVPPKLDSKSVRFADEVAAPKAPAAAPAAAPAPAPSPRPMAMPDDWDIAAAESFEEEYMEEEPLPPVELLQAAAPAPTIPAAAPPSDATAGLSAPAGTSTGPRTAVPTAQERQSYESALAAARPTAALPPLPMEPLDSDALRREEISLLAERRAAAGQSEAPTDVMFAECQELLQLFGLPYLIAPAEAEAQAAWLDAAGLVDGVVTDDNDALLFGARRLYRNIFAEKKYVEEYRAAELEREIGLTRERLVALALLLGSDYTPGVAGVGPVNALEVVRAFKDVDGLKRFADWIRDVDEELVALAKVAGGGKDEGKDKEEKKGKEEERKEEAEFKDTHRKVRKSWQLPSNFPSTEVMDAYLDPKVDPSKERFTYARPDLGLLRRFCEVRFGWTPAAADELLLPAIKAFDERQTQQTLDTFVSHREKFAKIRSKRLRAAVAGITGRDDDELAVPTGVEVAPSAAAAKKPRKPRAAAGKKKDADAAGGSGGGDDEVVIVEESPAPGAGRGRGRGRGRKAAPARRSTAAQKRQRDEEEGDGAEEGTPGEPMQ